MRKTQGLTVDQVARLLSKDRFFIPLGELQPTDFAARLAGAPLLECDALWEWLRADDWPEHALRHGDPTVRPLLELILGQRLLSLDTRLDPTALLTFWHWIVDHLSEAEALRNVWDVRATNLRETLRDDDSLELQARIDSIRRQEDRFVGVLEEVLEALRPCAALQWASDTIRRLIAQRRQPNDASVVRIVFAWSRPVDRPMQPAMLIELALTRQVSDGAPAAWINPSKTFGREFHTTVETIASAIGPRQFHPLQLHRDADDPSVFAGAFAGLTGTSGGLAIHVAQALANGRRAEALDPWVVLSASLDHRSGLARPIGAIESKLAALRQQAIRIVGIADDEEQAENAKRTAGPGMVFIRCRGSVELIVPQLRGLHVTHPVDLHRLKASRISRRTAIGLLASGSLAAAAGATLAHLAASPPRTLGMVHHDVDRLKTLARQYQRDDFRVTQDRTMYEAAALQSTVFRPPPGHRYTYLPTPPVEHSELGLLEGFDILENSVVWDSDGWVPVTPDALYRIPLEPVLLTRAVRMARLAGHPANKVATFELNCTGFGAEILSASGVGDFNVAWTYKRMKQASVPTKSYYMSVDVSNIPEGTEFLACVRAAVFNSCQDQTCRQRSHDWWGFRLYPNMRRASLAVRLPQRPDYTDLQKKKRLEKETEWREVDARDEESAGEIGLSYNGLRGWTVWSIPLGSDRAKTVYSIQWKWKVEEPVIRLPRVVA